MQSFILDRHTDPSNPVMRVTQDDKIPVYDTAADAEADFANIAEDQIYFTKEDKFDVDDMKDYIRKQNVLSDWESITLSTDSNNPTEMQYDGYISARLATQVGSMGTLYINSVAFTMIAAANAEHYRFTLPVKKGDSIYYVLNGSSIDDGRARFYKLRDYSDR